MLDGRVVIPLIVFLVVVAVIAVIVVAATAVIKIQNQADIESPMGASADLAPTSAGPR